MPCHHIDGTRLQCRAGGPTSSASVGDLEVRPALCSITLSSLPLSAPFAPGFALPQTTLPHRYLPLSHACSPHSLLLCVCIGFWVDTTTAPFISMHVDDAVHPPSHPLPFTWLRACPTPPFTPHHPVHLLSTVHSWLQCHFLTSYPCTLPQRACTAPISARHHSAQPAARTHARRTSPCGFPPSHSLPSIDCRDLLLFSVAV